MKLEQWVALGVSNATPLRVEPGRAGRKLAEQMLPFEGQLSGREGNEGNAPNWADLAPVKAVAASARLGMDRCQVGVDRAARMGMRAKSLELRMMQVATGFSPKNCAGK